MQPNGGPAALEYRAVIYLHGTDDEQLTSDERRCHDYAGRFGWHVTGTVRDHSANTSASQFQAKLGSLNPDIILTGNLAMISPDPQARDDLMAAIERSGYIVHPITTPAPDTGVKPSNRREHTTMIQNFL